MTRTIASSQVPDPELEPEDEEELREVLDAEELRSFLRSVRHTGKDSLLFDVRTLPGIRQRSLHSDEASHDSGSEAGVGRYRRMFVDVPENYERGLRIRSVISRSGSSQKGESVLKERSVLKWDIRGDNAGGSFGEISMSSSPGTGQSTSVTAHVVGEQRRWSLSLGDVTDRSAITALEDDRPVRLRALRPDRFPIRLGLEFSKPSYLRDAFTVSGIGFSAEFGQGTHASLLLGKKIDAREDGSSMSIGVSQMVSQRISIRAILRSDSDTKSVRPTLTAAVEVNHVLLGISTAIDPRGYTSSLVQALVQPSRAVHFSLAGWAKRVDFEKPGRDHGLSIRLRWRFAANHLFEVSSVGGELVSETGLRLTRGYTHARVIGKSFRSVEWSGSLRESMEGGHTKGSVSERRRSDHYLKVRVHLSNMLIGSVRLRHARLDSPGESGRSTALEWQLSGDLRPIRASAWLGVFRAEPGLTLWSSHPGFMLWPVSVVLGGTGSHWGVSVRSVVWERVTVAGYVSSIANDTPHALRSSILLEVAL